MTTREKLIVSAYTEVLMVDFNTFSDFVSDILGRSVFTHEFGSEEFAKKLKEAVKEEFMQLCMSEDDYCNNDKDILTKAKMHIFIPPEKIHKE